MVRCADFYEKWKKDPNWCEKSPKAVEQIDHYLSLVEEIADKNVDPIAIYKQFPERVAREVFKLKGDVRESVVTNSAGMIKRGEKVSTQDIDAWMGVVPKSTSQSGETKRTMVPNVTPDSSVKIKQEKKPEPVVEPVPDPVVPAVAPVPVPVPAPVLTQAKMVTAPVISGDPEKQKRAERNFHADELLERMPSSTKVMVTEIINEHRDWKVADVFYYGIQALAEAKKKR